MYCIVYDTDQKDRVKRRTAKNWVPAVTSSWKYV